MPALELIAEQAGGNIAVFMDALRACLSVDSRCPFPRRRGYLI
jgi:hypothetical protein